MHIPNPSAQDAGWNDMVIFPPSANASKIGRAYRTVLYEKRRRHSAYRLIGLAGRRVAGHQHLAVEAV
jgi:hypothetical protein